MAKESAEFASNVKNSTFVQLLTKLKQFGISQQEVATLIGISAGQISRVKQGKRPATTEHLVALRTLIENTEKAQKLQEKALASRPQNQSVFAVDQGVLNRLSAQGAVEAFRDLLFSRAAARGFPTTAINISSEVFTADGGVDASIADPSPGKLPADDLLDAGTRFQIKTGDFSPWQLSQLKKELFGKKSPRFESLGSSVQATLRDGRRIVFVCFGVDPIDKDLREAKKHLKELFTRCGYPKAKFDVWGQSHLIGLLYQYPALCLRLRGYDHEWFRSHESWSCDVDMQPKLFYSPKRFQLLCELQQELLFGKISHLRLLGEPGVGKTRFALEITKDERLEPLTLYIGEGRALLQSTFINELIQSDDYRFVVLVVDECSNKDRAELWNRLKAKSDRVRVISIDHGPDTSRDDRMRTVAVEPVGNDEIIAILMDHGVNKGEARRWSDYCEGCPRVAHVLGENLSMDCTNLLEPPATVDVWTRFVVGHDPPDSEEIQLRKIVLRYVALFERFGFESPVSDEAKYIATLAVECDPRLTWGRFQSIVRGLKQRRILQGATTLYITPRLLHIHLFREFWEHYGADFDISAAFVEMPQSLRNWLVRMLRYAHDTRAAERAIDSVLENVEFFPYGDFPNYGESGRIVEVLAEASPKSTLRCLQRTIGDMDVDSLQAVTEPRQLLVWAIEKIAVWRQHFVEASHLLLRLAEAENSDNGNNASGTFKQLFSLTPGLAPTQADPATRLTVLQETLASKAAPQRKLGLQACAKALDRSSDNRMAGPEYQGLRPIMDFWVPGTYGELWECHRAVWELLDNKRAEWDGEDKASLHSTLIEAAWSALHTPTLTNLVIATLKSIAHDPETDVAALVAFIKRQVRHKGGKLTDDAREKLREISASLEGYDFQSKLRRYVKFATWEDFHDDKGETDNSVDSILDSLADEAISDFHLLELELSWLVEESSNTAYWFAFKLCQRDASCAHYQAIRLCAAKGQQLEIMFISGYLAGVFARDITQWETMLVELAEDSAYADRFSDIVISSGMSEEAARKVIEQCRSGKQSIDRLERWWFASQLKGLSQSLIEEMIELHLETGTAKAWGNAVQICHTYFMEGDKAAPLPEELMLRLLLSDAMGQRSAASTVGYYWSRLASALLEQHPDRKWQFFREVVRIGTKDWFVLSDLHVHGEAIITELLREDPEKAFACIADAFEEAQDHWSGGLSHWLSSDGHQMIGDDSPGPIQYIPSKVLFAWVDEDIDQRAGWLANTLPKALGESVAGRLTRDFVSKYGDDKRISSSLHAHFGSRGWCGQQSDHYRRLRDEARSWLVDEKHPTVIRWVEKYIDGLAYSIDRAEVDEEREY